MKTLKLSIVIGLLTVFIFASCRKKDEPDVVTTYEEIGLSDISSQFSSLSGTGMAISDSNGLIWRVDDVIIYRTNDGRFGKFKVLNISESNYLTLSFQAVTYSADGKVFNEDDFITITENASFDLDDLTQNGQEDEMLIEAVNSTDTRLSPLGDAIFGEYTF